MKTNEVYAMVEAILHAEVMNPSRLHGGDWFYCLNETDGPCDMCDNCIGPFSTKKAAVADQIIGHMQNAGFINAHIIATVKTLAGRLDPLSAASI